VPSATKPTKVQPAKSSFADFRRKMQQQKKEAVCDTYPVVELDEKMVIEKDETKTFHAGFFSVTSPVRSDSTPYKEKESGECRCTRACVFESGER